MSLFSEQLFTVGDFILHGHCHLRQAGIAWLPVIPHGLTALSYCLIPYSLWLLRPKKWAFNWLFTLCCFFILGCAAAHPTSILTAGHQSDSQPGLLRSIPAIALLGIALAMTRINPRRVSARAQQEWERLNNELQEANEQLKAANQQLIILNQELLAAREETERRAEATEGLKFYQCLVDYSDDPVYWISPEDNFRFAYVNQATCRHFGFKQEELLSMSIPDWNPSFTWEDCSRFHQLLLQEKRLVFETDHRRSSGEIVPVEVSATLLFYQGKPYYGGYIKDLRERKNAEAALRESEKKYRSLFESSVDPMFLIDVQSLLVIDVNTAACQVYGYTREEMLQMRNMDLSAWLEETANTNHAGQGYARQQYHRKKDGTVFPAEINVGYTSPAGKQICIATIRDVSERFELNLRLEEEKQRLEMALWAADLGTWDWDVATGQVIFSERAAAMFGYQLNELRPHTDTWTELGHEEDIPRVLVLLQPHLAGEIPEFQAEHRVRCKDGSWKWILDSGKVISRDETGKPLRMVGIYLDITTRKQAEGEIRKLATVAQYTDNAVIITNASGTIEWVNDSFTRISGYSFDEAFGKKPGVLLQGPDTDPAAVDKMRDAISKGQGIELEVLNYTKDARPYWLYLSIRPVFDQSGTLRQFIAIETDITDRKQVEAERVRLIEQLSSQNRDLEQFAFITSHNLRAPVANMLGLVDLYNKEDVEDPINLVAIEGLGQAALRLDEVIHDLNELLAVRNRQEGQQELDFGRIWQQVQGHLCGQLAQSQAQVLVDFTAAPKVFFEKSYLLSIFFNLISNAIKYCSPERLPVIRIETRHEGEYTLLLVEDNGLGIDLGKYGDKIFGLYKRFHSHREGKGIGLHLIKTQVEAKGGKIEVESRAGEGSKFKVYFKSVP